MGPGQPVILFDLDIYQESIHIVGREWRSQDLALFFHISTTTAGLTVENR